MNRNLRLFVSQRLSINRLLSPCYMYHVTVRFLTGQLCCFTSVLQSLTVVVPFTFKLFKLKRADGFSYTELCTEGFKKMWSFNLRGVFFQFHQFMRVVFHFIRGYTVLVIWWLHSKESVFQTIHVPLSPVKTASATLKLVKVCLQLLLFFII